MRRLNHEAEAFFRQLSSGSGEILFRDLKNGKARFALDRRFNRCWSKRRYDNVTAGSYDSGEVRLPRLMGRFGQMREYRERDYGVEAPGGEHERRQLLIDRERGEIQVTTAPLNMPRLNIDANHIGLLCVSGEKPE